MATANDVHTSHVGDLDEHGGDEVFLGEERGEIAAHLGRDRGKVRNGAGELPERADRSRGMTDCFQAFTANVTDHNSDPVIEADRVEQVPADQRFGSRGPVTHTDPNRTQMIG